MRALIQRVNHASVTVNSDVVGRINRGLLVLVGITHDDTVEDIAYLVGKLRQLRVFNDDQGKMNLSISDINGEFLVVSQFTLFASTKKGNRPGYTNSASPAIAQPLFDQFIKVLALNSQLNIATGVFGAHMQVSLENDGPVTIILDSKNKE